MPTDSVVAEVRAAREAYASRFGFDLVAIGRDLTGARAGGGVVALGKFGSRKALPALEKLANDDRYTGALSVKGAPLAADGLFSPVVSLRAARPVGRVGRACHARQR